MVCSNGRDVGIWVLCQRHDPIHVNKKENKMSGILELLKGKKTYIMAVAGGAYMVLISLGIVPSIDYVWAVIGTATVASLRAGLPKE